MLGRKRNVDWIVFNFARSKGSRISNPSLLTFPGSSLKFWMVLCLLAVFLAEDSTLPTLGKGPVSEGKNVRNRSNRWCVSYIARAVTDDPFGNFSVRNK